jgi:hypothetical protein
MLIVFGGREKKQSVLSLDAVKLVELAVIAFIDESNFELIETIEYRSPSEALPDEEISVTFKAGHVDENYIYACTTTEVLIYDRNQNNKLVNYITHPWFNDVHHVLPSYEDDCLYVVSTGLDLVIKMTMSGDIVDYWNVLGKEQWKHFDRNLDYRKIASLKPHESHPNYIFKYNGSLWVTRFQQKDAVNLNDMNERLDIAVERSHDGIAFNDEVIFTSVNGHIVKFKGTDKQVYSLNEINNTNDALGWCRGVCPIVDSSRVYVGFSRLRGTKFKENLRWVKNKIKGVNVGSKPSRVSIYDLDKRILINEINMEKMGVNLIFSITRV